MDSNFVVWGEDVSSGYCVLGYIEEFEDDWKLTNGTSLAAEWPDDVTLQMDPDFKKQIKLSDHLCNPCRVIIASPALRQFLEEQAVPNLEFLPVRILNHKGKVASDDYVIVNLHAVQDCLDLDASGVTWNEINPDYIIGFEQLVLDESRIDEEATLFRAKHYADQMFVRRDFAEAVSESGLTGIEFYELSDLG